MKESTEFATTINTYTFERTFFIVVSLRTFDRGAISACKSSRTEKASLRSNRPDVVKSSSFQVSNSTSFKKNQAKI